jgi:tetratricopeptide (TPR) repeat protein
MPMGTGNDDDLVAGEALVQELAHAFDRDEQRDALDGIWACADRLLEAGRKEDALRLLDQLVAWQLAQDSDPDEFAAEEIAYTMLRRAEALEALDLLDEAVAQCNEVVGRCGKGNEPSLQGFMAEALSLRGGLLLRLERWLEAVVAFDDLIAREASIPDESSRWVAFARVERGMALKGLGDESGAAEAYAQAVAALAESEDPEIVALVQRTLAARGHILADLGKIDQALAVYDELIAIREPASPKSVADAYYRKAYRLAEGREFEAAIATTDAAMQRFGTSHDADIRVSLAYCLDEKIYALKGLGRKDAAAIVAEQLVERFGADLDPEIEKIVSRHAHRLSRSRSRLKFLDLG